MPLASFSVLPQTDKRSNRLLRRGEVTVDQRAGDLLLATRQLEPVRLELGAAGVAVMQRLPRCDEEANRFLQALEAGHGDRRLGSDRRQALSRLAA